MNYLVQNHFVVEIAILGIFPAGLLQKLISYLTKEIIQHLEISTAVHRIVNFYVKT